ncbi:MAG: DMT family transporter [Myxococcaceae bacterium]
MTGPLEVEGRPSRPALASLAVLVATAVWGGTFVTVKDALAQVDTFTFLALRFGLGAVVAAALASRTPLGDVRALLRAGLGLGALLFGGYVLQTLGLEHTTPARSAFVTGMTVIFVPFVSWRLERKRPPVRSFVAPVVALAGLQQLTGVGLGDLPSGDVLLGDALTFGCAVLYAFHIAGMSKWGKPLPSLALTAVQLAVVSLASTACLPFVERRFESTPTVWFAVVFCGVFASALAIAAQAWAQTQIPATRAAVIYSLEPLFTVVSLAALGLALPSLGELRGGALILVAVLVSEVDWARLRTSSPGAA